MSLSSDLALLKAELHSIPAELGVPTYRPFAIRKSYLAEGSSVPTLKDYLIYPRCKITNVPQRYVNESLSNGTVILSHDDLLIHNLPRIYPLSFLKENIEYFIIDPSVSSSTIQLSSGHPILTSQGYVISTNERVVSGIRCELIDVLDSSALHWKILLRKLVDRDPIAPAPLDVFAVPVSSPSRYSSPRLPTPGSYWEIALPGFPVHCSDSFEALFSDLESPTYYYYGGRVGTSWRVNRYEKNTLQQSRALSTNNPTYYTLNAAWAARRTLTYTPV